MQTRTREAVVAGVFYPADPAELRGQVEGFLTEAGKTDGPTPKAIIVPHAGYIYSGAVAACAYAWLKPEGISRVVLLGPSHRIAFLGLAATSAEAYESPLGSIPLESPPQNLPLNEAAHTLEHSLEVHLPFLQVILNEFTLLPLVVGDASKEEVAETLATLWGGPETLIVVSTDLSHYHDSRTARKMDQATSDAILALDADGLGPDSACGRVPVGGLLHLAKQKGLTIEQVDLRNSGDTAGPKDQVVGYGAYVLY